MGILFAVLSAAIFGIINYVDKFLLEKHNISPTVITIYGGISAFVAGCVISVFAKPYPIDIPSLMILLASGLLTTIYLLPYYKALSIDETSYVMPIVQIYPVFVLIMDFLLLGERLTLPQYAGSALMLLGAMLLSVERLERTILKLRTSFWYALLSGFIFAVAQVLYKFGVQEIPFWNTLPYEGFGIALGALAIAAYKDNFRKTAKKTKRFQKRVFVFITINELIYIIARYTGYFAISLTSVGLVSVLSALQPMFVLIFGIILSLWFPYIVKEAVTKKTIGLKLVSIVLIIAGTYFIFP